MPTSDIIYNHPAPPEWVQLSSILQAQLQTENRPFAIADAAYAVGHVAELDNERLETTLYHGLGLGGHDIANTVRDPERRRQAATRIADRLTASGISLIRLIEDPDREIEVADLAIPSLMVVGQLAEQTYNALPAHEHLLSDTLTIITRARRLNNALFENGQVRPVITSRIRPGHASVDLIVSNALLASTSLQQRALREKRRVNPSATYDELTMSRLLRVSGLAAGMHSEEFNGASLDKIIMADSSGQLVFNRKALPSEPVIPAIKVTEILHTARLGCPVLPVSGLIRGVMELIPDIVRAQEA